MNDLDLCDVIFDTLETMSSAAVYHYDNENMSAAAAIIEEWTDSNDQCILTHYLRDTTETLERELLYTSMDEELKEITYGTFTFIPDTTELPNQ